MKTKNKKHAPKSETRYVTPDPLRPRRNGKIAALDRDTREALNRQLRDNHTSDDILSWLNAQSAVQAVLDKQFKGQAINRQNLAEWRTGGYRDWENQECVLTWWEKKTKELAEKGGNPYQLGHQMAQIHAGQFLATLADLMATAPNAEARMKRLSRAMVEFRGWRRADYHDERMALEKQNSQWRRERENQELALKTQRLELDREKDKRETCEWIIDTLRHPKIKKTVYDDHKSYAETLKNVRVLMFGDKDEPEGSPESEVQSPKAGEDLQGPRLANGEKTTVENQGLAGSDGVSSTQKDKPVSNMSNQERKAFYELYLGMMLDLNAAGEDIRDIQGFSDAEKKHAALKAKQEEEEEESHNIEHPTSNIEHPVEDGNAEKGEEEKGAESSPESNVQSPESGTVEHSDEMVAGASPIANAEEKHADETSALPGADNLQPSTCNLQPSVEGPMTLKQAEKVVDEWYQKARRLGGIVVNSWDVADMRAYLSQQPAPYYSLKTGDHEFREPPARDPRFDPASPWSKAWPYLEAERRANEKN